MSKLLALPEKLANRRQHDHFWDFTSQPDAYALPLEPVTAGANADDDVAATLVGIVPVASRILGGYLVVSANSAGVAAAPDASVWTVAVGGATAITKTNAANLVANTPVALGAPVLPDAAAGAAVTLAITNGTNADLNSAVCHVVLSMAKRESFPAPGLELIASNAGTATISDGVNGVLALSPGTADNDEIYLCTSTELFKFLDQKPFYMEARLYWAEAATDDANVAVGFKDAVAADSILDDGGGPAASYSGAMFFKTDGSTTWQVETSVGATQTTKTLDADGAIDKTVHRAGNASGGAVYEILRIEVHPYTSTQVRIEFYIGRQTATSDWNLQHVRTIYQTIAGATEMQAFIGLKNGSANAETINIDYLACGQLR